AYGGSAVMAVTEERQVLRQSLEEHQRDLREAVTELRLGPTPFRDRRDPIRERPFRWLAVGAVVGLWLGWRRGNGKRGEKRRRRGTDRAARPRAAAPTRGKT